jgi:serine/threonine protein kinase/tetratricopeptide (TPR) repeat protein
MYQSACPAPGELCRFLDELLEPTRQAEIGIHIDDCESCQTALEALTQRRATDLLEISTENSRVPVGHINLDQVGTDERDSFNENGANADSWLQLDTDPQPNPPLDGPSPADPDRTKSYISPRDASTDSGSDDPNDLAGPPNGTNGTETDFRRLPEIAGYELIELLGEGGMGVVYKSRQLGLNRLVAVKMIRTDRRGTADRLARFRTEAEAVARLRHPNIVQIFEIGEANGAPFVSLELLEGSSLDDKLATTPQPGRAAAELLITLANAVQVAHDEGIIHRDLKPSNILFSKDGVPKITDFGLAKLDADSRLTEPGQIMGSPSYMAPEQARGEARNVGRPADLYALGAILYEMLTGRPPFKGETPIETVHQVINDDVVPPSRLVSKIARDLETICLHCLNKEQSRRYRSAAALADDLRRYLSGRTIQARPTPFWERGVKLARRHPVAATVLSIVMLTTAGLSWAWRARGSREAHRIDVLTSTVMQDLFKAQNDIAHERWSDVEPTLTALREKIGRERNLGELARRTDALLASAKEGRVAAEKKRQDLDTKRHDQETLQTFRRRHKEALFHETHFPGIELPYDPQSVTTTARAALATLAAPGSGDSWKLGPLPATFTPREGDEIKEVCFELFLILADAERQPKLRLELLDQAGRLRSADRAYHRRRADCLAQLGDPSGASLERQKADSLPLASAIDHFLLGKELFQRRSWAEAVGHFDSALLSEPGHFWCRCLSGICSLELQRPDRARSEFSACVQAEPRIAWLYDLRGYASYEIAVRARIDAHSAQARDETMKGQFQDQLQAAEDDYAKALELLDASPENALRYALLVNRGLVWVERRNWDKATSDFEAAIRIDGGRWIAFQNLAAVLAQQNEPDQAIEQLNRAIGLRPDFAVLHRQRAVVNLQRKDQGPTHRACALADLEKAIAAEPAGSSSTALNHVLKAGLLHHEQREVEALRACEAALKSKPEDIDAHQLRLKVLVALKRFDDVIRSCNALLAAGRNSADLLECRSLARQNQKDYVAASEDLTLAIGVRPDSASLLAKRGALYLVTYAPQSALRDFQDALRLDAANPDALVGRGLAHAALGQYLDAVADADRALKMAEPTAKRLYGAARIYAQAAYAVGAEVRKNGQQAVSQFTRYQDEAIGLLREWLNLLPAADRASSIRDLKDDPAMAVLRHRLRSLEMAKTS